MVGTSHEKKPLMMDGSESTYHHPPLAEKQRLLSEQERPSLEDAKVCKSRGMNMATTNLSHMSFIILWLFLTLIQFLWLVLVGNGRMLVPIVLNLGMIVNTGDLTVAVVSTP